MARAGDKYIIEIEEELVNAKCDFSKSLYRVKGFNSLVFDENGLKKLEKFETKNEVPSHGFRLGDEIIDEEGDLGVVIMSKESGIMYMDASTCTWFVRTAEMQTITKTGTRYPEMVWILEALQRDHVKKNF